jgi:hypothetical protein
LIDLVALETHEKKEIKVERIIFHSVKDHIIPHLFEKNTTKDMFDSLVFLFQSTNMNMKMVLRNRPRCVQMSRSDNVTSYFMRITQVCDQFVSIREKMDDLELVNMALNSLPKSWERFVKGFCAREKLKIGRGFGMIASRKRLKRSLRETSKEAVMTTWPLSVRQGRAKERVLARKVTVMEDHHNHGRRRT